MLVGCGGSQDGDVDGAVKKNTEAGTFTMAISYMGFYNDTASEIHFMVRDYDVVFGYERWN